MKIVTDSTQDSRLLNSDAYKYSTEFAFKTRKISKKYTEKVYSKQIQFLFYLFFV